MWVGGYVGYRPRCWGIGEMLQGKEGGCGGVGSSGFDFSSCIVDMSEGIGALTAH